MQSIDAEAYYSRVNTILQQSAQKQQSATIQIPVVFHIVYNSAQENIPDSLIYQQLEIMNADFRRENPDTANTPAAFHSIAGAMDIEFCLAQQTPSGLPTNGILRVQTNQTAWPSPTTYAVPDPVKHSNQGGSDAWDTEHYLNIWICNLQNSTAYSAPPGNFMPDDEGIVCKYQHVGITNVYPYGHGRSIVHELGHYFCLRHVWGDDNGACTGTDYINDTPNQGQYSTNCPNFPLTDACSPSSPGVMFMNYMDYSADECRNMFSQGQCAYMLSCITSLRSGFLTTGTACLPVVAIDNPKDKSDLQIFSTQNDLRIKWIGRSISNIQLFDLQGHLIEEYSNIENEEIQIEKRHIGLFLIKVSAFSGEKMVQKILF